VLDTLDVYSPAFGIPYGHDRVSLALIKLADVLDRAGRTVE